MVLFVGKNWDEAQTTQSQRVGNAVTQNRILEETTERMVETMDDMDGNWTEI